MWNSINMHNKAAIKCLKILCWSYRCMWSNWPGPRGVPAGEGPGGPDRVREVAVSQPASTLRPFTAAPPGSARRASQPHLPALLHAPGGQDTDRDADPRHAAIRKLHQLAIRTGTVNQLTPGWDRPRSDWEESELRKITWKYKLNVMNTNRDLTSVGSLFVNIAFSISAQQSLEEVTPKLLSGKQKCVTVFKHMFAALVSFALTSFWSLSVSFGTEKQQGFSWIADFNMRPRACTTSSNITPIVTQFEPSLCVFPPLNEAISVPLSQADGGSFRALIVTGRKHCADPTWSCVIFDMCDKISNSVTKYIYDDCKASPCTALKQRPDVGIVLYSVLYEALRIQEQTFCMLWGIVQHFGDVFICFPAEWDKKIELDIMIFTIILMLKIWILVLCWKYPYDSIMWIIQENWTLCVWVHLDAFSPVIWCHFSFLFFLQLWLQTPSVPLHSYFSGSYFCQKRAKTHSKQR